MRRRQPEPAVQANSPDTQWLSATEIRTMRQLLEDEAVATDPMAAHSARVARWRLFPGAWSFPGTFEELLAYWAEDRRHNAGEPGPFPLYQQWL